MLGKIYLIPSEMGEQDATRLFPQHNFDIVSNTKYFIVEKDSLIYK